MSEPASFFSNRLIKEKSPYLLQHAHNPVDWYPWGEEAFKAARDLDKPIFLSIGYATCHWCHVMRRESFDNPEIAKLLNEVFINIKIDREELPEVDRVYMQFAQAMMSFSGGWPLNVVLTPELRPFFAATYLPPTSHKGLMGIDQFCQHLRQIWQSEQKEALLAEADKIVEVFKRSASDVGFELPGEEAIALCAELFFKQVDPIFGGIKGEPKFPMGYQWEFLIAYAQEKNDSRSLFCAELTLEMMSRGGICDHVGGGFSRYTIDEKWCIPHFEKMLYDNALLAKAYVEAWKCTKKPIYRFVCEGILQYALQDLMLAEGAFCTAEDADSEGQEGLFYTWTPQEVSEAFSGNNQEENVELFCAFYGVTQRGNFQGRSVLHTLLPMQQFAEVIGQDIAHVEKKLAQLRQVVFQCRQQRKRPFKDDKVITAWNGLMIDALIHAASSWDNAQFRDAAVTSARFIRTHLWKEGKLLRRYREGESRFTGHLTDYAFLIKGILSLFDAGCGKEYLDWAIELASVLESDYKAPKGAFYQTSEQESVLARKCEYDDGAEPSGNAVHSENLLRLHRITQDERYIKQAEDIFKAAKPHIELNPLSACYLLMSLQRYYVEK